MTTRYQGTFKTDYTLFSCLVRYLQSSPVMVIFEGSINVTSLLLITHDSVRQPPANCKQKWQTKHHDGRVLYVNVICLAFSHLDFSKVTE